MDNITFLKYISIIQRNTGRYFDMSLEPDHIGSGQQFFLLRIAENEGLTMLDLAQTGCYDKGTVTRAVQKLVRLGYVRMDVDKHDKRVRHLYTLPEAQPVIARAYHLRNDWKDRLTQDFTEEEKTQVFDLLQRIAENSEQEIEQWHERSERE